MAVNYLAMLIFAKQLSLFNWLAFAVVLLGIYLAVSAKNNMAKLPIEN